MLNKYSTENDLSAQENPSEEDAAIVDKILAMRVTKKEVRSYLLSILFIYYHFNSENL